MSIPVSQRRSWPLVDPELRPLLELFPEVELDERTLAEIRARELPVPEVQTERPVELRTVAVPGPAGAPDVQVRIYRPADAAEDLPCILHIHGGGFVAGAAEELEAIHRPMAAQLDCVIVATDYRLGPEHSYPAAIDDCYAALAWTFDNASALGIAHSRIGVAGESAGGGLAAALALLARDRGEYLLAFQNLVYPMLDDRTCADEPHPWAGEYVWTPHNNRFGWRALLGHEPGMDGVSPYAAPARAEDLSGLPPTFISTAALDLFVDEDLDYARRLMRVGVQVELHVYPGAFHGFDFAPDAAVSQAAQRDRVAALRRALGPAAKRPI